MLSALRRVVALPPVRVAVAMAMVTAGLSIVSDVAKRYREAVDGARAELAALRLDLRIERETDPLPPPPFGGVDPTDYGAVRDGVA